MGGDDRARRGRGSIKGSLMPATRVIILAGGRGTRLPLSARDIPKSLVEVRGRPIIAHQLQQLRRAGFHDRNIRLALGFRAEQIIAFLARAGYGCQYVSEPEPLGTGGAVALASRGLEEPFLVLNGDTLADFDFPAILASHEPPHALLVSHWKDDARDFGLLDLERGFIREFLEKPSESRAGYINAGCYLLAPEHLEAMAPGFWMLETELFPRLALEGRLKTHVHHGRWDDLGTEERLALARSAFAARYG